MSNIINFPVATERKFEVGKTYTCTSIGDSDCVYEFTVLKRSKKTVTLKYHGETHVRRISINDGEETCSPFGSYSMSPTLQAGKVR